MKSSDQLQILAERSRGDSRRRAVASVRPAEMSPAYWLPLLATLAAVILLLPSLLRSQGREQGPVDATRILKGVEERYNNASTLTSEFTQNYKDQGRTRAVETGTMILKKPGRTRWEYDSPAGKLFISDGKYSYDYDPATKRARRERMKDTDDVRIPLAFLLGKLDFHKDFSEFRARPEGQDAFITAVPKSDKLLFTDISMLIAPDSTLKQVIITFQNYSRFEYIFENEKRNVAAPDSLFEFEPPAGAEYVDAAE